MVHSVLLAWRELHTRLLAVNAALGDDAEERVLAAAGLTALKEEWVPYGDDSWEAFRENARAIAEVIADSLGLVCGELPPPPGSIGCPHPDTATANANPQAVEPAAEGGAA